MNAASAKEAVRRMMEIEALLSVAYIRAVREGFTKDDFMSMAADTCDSFTDGEAHRLRTLQGQVKNE